jgi:anti-sigma factor RsiW
VTNPIDLMCQEAVELVTEYMSHTLPAEDRVRFEKHLLTCPPCTAYLAQMRTTVELADGIGTRAPTEVMEPELIDLFRRWKQK